MASGPSELVDPDDFPALFGSADQTSLKAQKSFTRSLKVRLGGLLVATIGGILSFSVDQIEFGGLVSLVAFLTALGAELFTATTRPDRSWYEGRAAAESVKTLTWRFVVRGESFEDINDVTSDQRFLNDLKEILQDLDALELSVSGQASTQITKKMRQVRDMDFTARRKFYLEGRILDQQKWYARKSKWNKDRAARWVVASITFEFAGVVGGALRAFGVLQLDLLGLLAAGAATVVAWVQAKQYDTLATAYGVTALELASVNSEGELVTTEPTWAKFVGEAEEAISREHTLWRASRGLRLRAPRG